MSRPVPEAAPLVGLVLAFAFALYGLLFPSNHLATVLGSVLLWYPFVAFGVLRSESPETVFRPDPVLAAGFLGGSLVACYGVVSGQFHFGALVASVVAVPPALYHARYGESVNPLSPDATLVAGLLMAGLLLVAGASGELLVAATTAAFVGLAAVDYRRQRGGPFADRARTVAVGCCLGGGLVAFGALAVIDRPAIGLGVGAVLLAVGGSLAIGPEPQ